MKIDETELLDLLQAISSSKAGLQLRPLLLREWFLWKWTTRQGKYRGCQYWSARALEQYEESGESDLRHEHVIPRVMLAEILETKLTGVDFPSLTTADLKIWLDQMCLGCVLTVEEDRLLGGALTSRMPHDWDNTEPWARYRQAFHTFGITIWRMGPQMERLNKHLEFPCEALP